MNRFRSILFGLFAFMAQLSYSQDVVSMLENNPVWSFYYIHNGVDWENCPYDYDTIMNEGPHYYGFDRHDDMEFPYIEKAPSFKYFFTKGCREYNGRTYKVAYTTTIREGQTSITDEDVEEVLLLREEDGKILTPREPYWYYRSMVTGGSIIEYYEENDETIIYDFKTGISADNSWFPLRGVSQYVALDGSIRKIWNYDGVSDDDFMVIEGIGVVGRCWGDPFLPFDEEIFEEYEEVIYDLDLHFATLNAFYSNSTAIYKAKDYAPSEDDNQLAHLRKYGTSYHEPPLLKELQDYISKSESCSILDSNYEQKTAIFDLTGRRLSNKPKKGIYLEEGKVKMVR